MQQLHLHLSALSSKTKSVLCISVTAAVLAMMYQPGPRPAIQASLLKPILPTERYPILGKCTGYEELDLWQVTKADYIVNPDKDAVDIWTDRFHTTVDTIVEEYLEESTLPAQCDAEEPDKIFVPGNDAELKKLAEKLPPWEHADELAKLTRSDINAVLLEYVRSYECALIERSLYLGPDVFAEISFISGISLIEWSKGLEEFLDQETKIGFELKHARPTIHRLVNYLGGLERLKPLEGEAECLQRASVDIRNGLALGAEAASCLPRVWNARDPLRDYDKQPGT